MLKIMNLKMIERTFPPLNIWWVRTQKFSPKLQAKCSFTHPTKLTFLNKTGNFSKEKYFIYT